MSSMVFEGPGSHGRARQDLSIEHHLRSSRWPTPLKDYSLAQKLTGLLRWGAGSMAVALALAGCGGGGGAGDAVQPTAAAPIQLEQVAALTLAQESVNGRLAMPRAGALAAVSRGTATEDFEAGMSRWSDWGNAQVVAGAGTSGSSAMQVGTGAGGAGLTVAGMVPGTAYRLTAQVKVTDPSDPVVIGVNMLSSSGEQVIGQSSPLVTGTGYVTVTVDLVAPADAATAVVWIWKNAGTGFGYLDDVSFGPPTSPPPPPPGPPASNLVSNGGFESGMIGWDNWGNASAVSGQANSGTSALSVGTAAGGAGQTIGGIAAGTVYRLVAQAKVSDPSETVFVGVNLLNQAGAAAAQMALPVSSTTYSTITFDITAPSDAVSAVVFVWKNDGSGFGYVDDVVFGVAPGSAPPPPPPSSANLIVNGGFENGLASWVNWGNTVASTSQAAAGSYAAQVGTEAGGTGQTVGGVVVGTTYRASAQVKVSSPGELGYFGLKFVDAAGNVLGLEYATFNSTAYSTVQVDLAAPANATSALVYVWKNAGSGFAYADEVSLAQAPTSPSTPTVSTTFQIAATADWALPQLARLPDGGFVAVWSVFSDGIFAQRYAADGTASGSVIRVSPVLTNWQFSSPRVTALTDGSIVVLWRDNAVGTPARSQLRRVLANGTLGYGEGAPNAPGDQQVVALGNGGYVVFSVSWQGAISGISPADTTAQAYTSADQKVGTPLVVVPAGLALSDFHAAATTDGGYAAAWAIVQPSGAPANVYLRRAAADGTLGSPVLVGAIPGGGPPTNAFVFAALKSGGFAFGGVGFQTLNGQLAQLAQVLLADANGTALGAPFDVDDEPDVPQPSCTPGAPVCARPLQNDLTLAALDDGGVAAAWSSTTRSGGSRNVFYARLFSAQGAPTSRVASASDAAGAQIGRMNSIGTGNDGFVVAWTAGSPSTTSVDAHLWAPATQLQ